MNKRLEKVASALADAVQAVLEEQRVTEDAWRAGVVATMSTGPVKEHA